MKNTIFTQFLTALKVKHTAAFSDKLYRIVIPCMDFLIC